MIGTIFQVPMVQSTYIMMIVAYLVFVRIAHMRSDIWARLKLTNILKISHFLALISRVLFDVKYLKDYLGY